MPLLRGGRRAMGIDERWQVEPDADREAARALMAQDRIRNGWAIGDLDPPFAEHSTVALAGLPGVPPSAYCLVLRHPSFTAIMSDGPAAGVEAIVAAIELPPAAHLLVDEAHGPIFDRLYAAPVGWHPHLRMAVDAFGLRPPNGASAAQRLGPADLDALLDLYTGYERSAFYPDQLHTGIFYGVRDGGGLVAAGGTHLLAPVRGFAAVGNIYTHPEARGRGYASAVTAAVTAELLESGYRDVFLNVDETNAPAIAVYTRLGYHVHCRYLEANVVRR